MKKLNGYGTYIFVVLGVIVFIAGSRFQIPGANEIAILLFGAGGIRLRQAIDRKGEDK